MNAVKMTGKMLGGFLHLPKCGGMSIRGLIPNHLNLMWLESKEKWWRTKFNSRPKNPPTFIEDLTAEQKDRLYVFTFVRNPWDRMISLWKVYNRKDEKSFTKYRTFEETLEIICDPSIVSEIKKEHNTPEKWYKSLETIKGGAVSCERRINYFMSKGINIDFIGRFENYEDDWNKVCSILKIDAKLPHLNKTKHDHYSVYYNDQTKKKVAQLLKDDIEAFGYQFEKNHMDVSRILEE